MIKYCIYRGNRPHTDHRYTLDNILAILKPLLGDSISSPRPGTINIDNPATSFQATIWDLPDPTSKLGFTTKNYLRMGEEGAPVYYVVIGEASDEIKSFAQSAVPKETVVTLPFATLEDFAIYMAEESKKAAAACAEAAAPVGITLRSPRNSHLFAGPAGAGAPPPTSHHRDDKKEDYCCIQ